ncbi:MAG: HEAT repeat domain-containing protein [Cyanobacteriota bacterium]
MFKKTLLVSLILSLCIQVNFLQAFSYSKEELIQFIKNNTYKNVIENEEKDEEFQILVRVATNQEIKNLQEMVESPNTREDQKVLALRALGTIKNYESINIIQDILTKSTQQNIVYMATWALIQIGGKTNYEFIVGHFNRIEKIITDKDLLFLILVDLSEKYKSNYELKYNAQFLKAPENDSFKTIFLFTVFGRNLSSELILFEALNSPTVNIRLNATRILGEWYASPNAVKPFVKLLKTEKNEKIRNAVIKGLEAIATKEALDALETIAKRPFDSDERKYAQEALFNVENLWKNAKKDLKSGYIPDQHIFKRELAKLMDSKGNFGSYRILEKNAVFQDVFLLDRLREAIMLRTSHDAMKDYNKVTRIITIIRIKHELT